MKQGIIITLIFIVLGLIFFYWIGYKNRKNKDNLWQNGIETVGVLINRTKTTSGVIAYGLRFEFYTDKGELVSSYYQVYDEWLYTNAIIGMKYKVIYLPESPQFDAIIFIENPKVDEYKNIEKERAELFKKYNWIKKNARPLNEIDNLFPPDARRTK